MQGVYGVQRPLYLEVFPCFKKSCCCRCVLACLYDMPTSNSCCVSVENVRPRRSTVEKSSEAVAVSLAPTSCGNPSHLCNVADSPHHRHHHHNLHEQGSFSSSCPNWRREQHATSAITGVGGENGLCALHHHHHQPIQNPGQQQAHRRGSSDHQMQQQLRLCEVDREVREPMVTSSWHTAEDRLVSEGVVVILWTLDFD